MITLCVGSKDRFVLRRLNVLYVATLQDLVKGMIEGETRVLAANMGMEEIFNARKGFQVSLPTLCVLFCW